MRQKSARVPEPHRNTDEEQAVRIRCPRGGSWLLPFVTKVHAPRSSDMRRSLLRGVATLTLTGSLAIFFTAIQPTPVYAQSGSSGTCGGNPPYCNIGPCPSGDTCGTWGGPYPSFRPYCGCSH